MKNKIICLIAFSMFATAGFAQSTMGFYVGPNFSNINIKSPNLSVKNHSGYQFGGFFRKGGFIYGQLGLEYQKIQTNLTTTDSLGQTSGAVDLNRLQLPIYGGLNLLNFSKKVLNVRAYAGPVITYTMTASSFNPDFSLTDFSRLGVNGTIGAGLDVLIFSLDAGYNFGLNNLFSKSFNGKADYAFVNVGLKF